MSVLLDSLISDYPCAVCMGFCLEEANCIQCDLCLNWFHRECVNLSLKKFTELTNDLTSKFTCTICIHDKPCGVCNIEPSLTKRNLYCMTCLKHICDNCNPLPNTELATFHNSDKPYYCLPCSIENFCNVCKKRCYQDAIHEPYITCAKCKESIHFSCSKLTKRQFNILKLDNSVYYCNKCIHDGLPFASLPKSSFSKFVNQEVFSCRSSLRENINCTLCVACLNECDECITCPDNHRICEDCTLPCKYVNTPELDNTFLRRDPSDLAILRVNIRSYY